MEVGLFTFLLGIFRLGFLDAVLSRALLRGFITAVGCVICIEQLIPLLGLSALEREMHLSSAPPIEKLIFVIQNVHNTHRLTACISLVAFCLLILAKIYKPRVSKRMPWVTFVPEVLIVVAVATCKSGSPSLPSPNRC